MDNYVHGYSERETERLYDQADSVKDLLHHDTGYPAGARVLEAGCGVGAQTVTLARKSPGAFILAIDISNESLCKAQALITESRVPNVAFQRADLFSLPFAEESFDHIFLCFVLEHLARPERALTSLRTVLKPGGSLTVIEGDHGSCYFHPQTEPSLHAWNCLVQVQASLGGNSLIGRQLFPLLDRSHFQNICISPRMVYVDRSKPQLMDSFVNKTIIPMVEGVKKAALQRGLIDELTWRKGIRDLHGIAESDEGTFCYTFFKAVCIK
jgi:SAM-dependent methyltransferase